MNVSLAELVNVCPGVTKKPVRTKPNKGVRLPYRLHFRTVRQGELFGEFFEERKSQFPRI